MKAVRLPIGVLAAVLVFTLWNAAWVTDRCEEWADALDGVTAALDGGGNGSVALERLWDMWQEVQGYMLIVVSHTELDEAESLLAQALALCRQNSTEDMYPVLAELRGQFRLIAETQRVSAKNIF